MKKQPDNGMDALHTRLTVAKREYDEQPSIARANYVCSILCQCNREECEECSKVMCPSHDPLHYHHDGCPTCDYMER